MIKCRMRKYIKEQTVYQVLQRWGVKYKNVQINECHFVCSKPLAHIEIMNCVSRILNLKGFVLYTNVCVFPKGNPMNYGC